MIKILMYHNIDPCRSDRFVVSPSRFENQLKFFKLFRYRVITLSEINDAIANKESCQPTVVITFDDGYEDNYKYALPLLKKYGMKATVFAVAGQVGLDNEWDRAKRKRQFRHMGWDELREWSRQGMEVGSHAMNHCKLGQITSDRHLRDEISVSKQILEEKLQQPIRTFSYPWGSFDNRVQKMVRETGYQAAVSTKPGVSQADSDMYALPRYEVYAQMNIVKFGFRVIPWSQ